MFDALRDRWEHMALRERRLLGALGITLVVCVFLLFGVKIRNGLRDLEKENARLRAAIETIEDSDPAATKGSADDIVSQIGDEAPQLGTLLESLEATTGVKIRDQQNKKPVDKGKFKEKALAANTFDVTLPQLIDFLSQIESRPTIATQRLKVHRSTNDPEKFDRVELTVATYERSSKSKKPKAETKSAPTDAGPGPTPPKEGAPQ